MTREQLPPDPLDATRQRIADLSAALDAAPDEATARPLADELHGLMDSLENVRELRPPEAEE